MKLIPTEGSRVRDPKSKLIVGPEGVEISKLDTFWFRRIQDGSMIEAPVLENKEKVSKKASPVKEEK